MSIRRQRYVALVLEKFRRAATARHAEGRQRPQRRTLSIRMAIILGAAAAVACPAERARAQLSLREAETLALRRNPDLVIARRRADSAVAELGIARALMIFNTELRGKLKAEGLVTRDSRGKERKKYGQKGARARFQFSKR